MIAVNDVVVEVVEVPKSKKEVSIKKAQKAYH